MYEELTAKIRDLNGSQNLDKVAAGTTLLVPQIPKAVWRDYATASLNRPGFAGGLHV